MSNFISYGNITAYHPGYYISDLIDELGITQEELAYRLEITPKNLSELVNGKAPLSKNIAIKLSTMLGTSIEMWLNLQNQFDLADAEIKKLMQQENDKKLLSYIDYSFFVKLGILPAKRLWKDKLEELCKFLKIGTLSALTRPDLLVSYRQVCNSVIDEKITVCSNIWVQTVLNKAENINVSKFNRNKLLDCINIIRELTLLPPSTVYPDIKKRLADCGVALVLLPSIKNSGIHGAIKWINADKVVLGITDRGKDTDKFWFSLFHEIGHILQPKTKNLVVSGSNYTYDDKLEEEADLFAQNTLIPKDEYERFISRNNITRSSIKQFAWEIHRHPGIIVGRLQKDKLIPFSHFNDLKSKYEIN